MKFFKQPTRGFTLIEVMVAVTIISLLSAVLFANFNDARMQSRDKSRMAALKQMQLAIEVYRAQNGRYPAQGCGAAGDFAGPGPASLSGLASCATYVTSLAPDFIPALASDPKFESVSDKGFYYRTNVNGTSYKLMIFDTVETLTVTAYGDEFARCPVQAGACSGVTPPANTYAVYSAGAEDW